MLRVPLIGSEQFTNRLTSVHPITQGAQKCDGRAGLRARFPTRQRVGGNGNGGGGGSPRNTPRWRKKASNRMASSWGQFFINVGLAAQFQRNGQAGQGGGMGSRQAFGEGCQGWLHAQTSHAAAPPVRLTSLPRPAARQGFPPAANTGFWHRQDNRPVWRASSTTGIAGQAQQGEPQHVQPPIASRQPARCWRMAAHPGRYCGRRHYPIARLSWRTGSASSG